MARRLYVDGAAGKIAIYDTTGVDFSTENEPLATPLSYVSRLHFHSDLDYPAIIQTVTGTVTLGAMSANTQQQVTHTLFSHGRAGTPYVEGRIEISGTWIPLAGSVPVDQQSGVNAGSFARFLALGANGSTVTLEEYSISHMSTAYSAVSFDYIVYLTNVLVA